LNGSAHGKGGARRRARASLLLAGALVAPLLPAEAGSATPPARTHTVTIRGFEYQPPRLSVRRGDTVVWINRDIVPHTATAPGAGMESGSIPADGSWRYVAARRGSYVYDCTFHPNMRGVLRVR
jgi:plastocyanin